MGRIGCGQPRSFLLDTSHGFDLVPGGGGCLCLQYFFAGLKGRFFVGGRDGGNIDLKAGVVVDERVSANDDFGTSAVQEGIYITLIVHLLNLTGSELALARAHPHTSVEPVFTRLEVNLYLTYGVS